MTYQRRFVAYQRRFVAYLNSPSISRCTTVDIVDLLMLRSSTNVLLRRKTLHFAGITSGAFQSKGSSAPE